MKIEPVRSSKSDTVADAYDEILNKPSPALDKPVPEKIDPVKSTNQTELRSDNNGHRDITFGLDQESDLIVIKVVDQKTGDVVRSTPPELTVKLAREIKRAQKEQQQQTAR